MPHNRLHIIGRVISIVIMASSAIVALLVIHQVNANPRTDDAEVFANFIGMAPLVNGPVTHLYVSDNQLVKAGAPLFDIDDRPYAYALARAQSDQTALHGQIGDERRRCCQVQRAWRRCQPGACGSSGAAGQSRCG